MELCSIKVKKVRRAAKAKREKKVMQALLVLRDCQEDQDWWVQKVNPLWVLLVLLAPQDSLVFPGLDDLVLEVHRALLDLQDLHLTMDQMSLFLAHLVPPAHLDLQDMPTRSPSTRPSMV